MPGREHLQGLGETRPATVADQVFEAIYRQVVTLELPPGSRLSEVEVARSAGVSRQPVRDALKRTRPGGKPQAAQKYWQELLGQTGGAVRRPMLPLAEPERAAIRAA